MSGGYTATTDALSSASKNIGRLSEQLLDDNPDLSSTPVDAAGFGQAHGAHAAKYTAGVTALWAAVSGYSSTLGSFGTNLGTMRQQLRRERGKPVGRDHHRGG